MRDMRIGALTACAPRMSLEQWMQTAKDLRLDGLEVACFPAGNLNEVASGQRKDWVADTLNLDEPLTLRRAEEIKTMSRDYGVAVHSLGAYLNNLHNADGVKNREHMRRVIDAARMLESVMPAGPLVATFVGIDPTIRVEGNLDMFKANFVPLLQYAKERGVRVMIENCPMEGWENRDLPINNLMCAPVYWDACFKIAEESGVGDVFGLEYDPSHRVWQLAGRKDLVQRDVLTYGCKKMFALHGKGAKFKEGEFWSTGIEPKLVDLGKEDCREWGKRNCYEHAVPGIDYDSVNWRSVIALARNRNVPMINIEIEDPAFKDMKDAVRCGELGVQAVKIGRENLARLCYYGDSYNPNP